MILHLFFFFFQAEDGIRDVAVTGVQTCALPIFPTFLRLNAGSPPRVPGRTAGNWERGLRSLRDLTQHLTTRADDSHAAPVLALRRGADVSTGLRSEEHTLNSSHGYISYAVFCLKKKKKIK